MDILEWVYLAEDKCRQWAFVKTVMNRPVLVQ